MSTLQSHAATLARFEHQQAAWERNPALRTLYAYWYQEVKQGLGPAVSGDVLEIGSGPGFSRRFLPGLCTSDTAKAPWHDLELDATQPWPFEGASWDGIVLFDVLHHLADPARLFLEASRTLRGGGRLVMMEPYVSPCSYPVYRFFHEEGADTSVDPWAQDASAGKDPFDGNQAIPGLIFGRYLAHFQRSFPELKIVDQRFYPGFSYAASGGFNRRPLLPLGPWRALYWLDRHVPRGLQRWLAFRILIVIHRT